MAAAFSAVNESTWEHMETAVCAAFFGDSGRVCFLGRTYANFLAVRASSALVGLALIPTLFYTYTGILGYHLMWADIAVFLLADLGMFVLDFRLLSTGRRGGAVAADRRTAGAVGPWRFVRMVHLPPAGTGAFLDPTTMRYGLPQ